MFLKQHSVVCASVRHCCVCVCIIFRMEKSLGTNNTKNPRKLYWRSVTTIKINPCNENRMRFSVFFTLAQLLSLSFSLSLSPSVAHIWLLIGSNNAHSKDHICARTYVCEQLCAYMCLCVHTYICSYRRILNEWKNDKKKKLSRLVLFSTVFERKKRTHWVSFRFPG